MLRFVTRIPAMAAAQQVEQVGLDMSLLDESLRCSYEQRAVQHQQALTLALEMERAGRQLRDRTQSSAAASLRR